ncbi:MAG: carboxypeptidase-like regulatory domain-containing protein [Blastocatellia bacterium]
MRYLRKTKWSLFLSGFLLGANLASAQSFTATVTGKVKDEAGEVVPGLRVSLLNVATNRSFGRGKRFFNRNGAVNALLGNWQFNTLMRLMDGQPFTPQLANFNFGLGESKRPDRLGSGKLDNPGPEKWFKIEDFVPVPRGAFRFGTAGRNILTGPGRRLVDVSLLKNFVFSDQKRLQFRFEAFNAINAANFQLPNRNIDVPQAATINQAQNGREIQFGLKLLF